MKRGMRCLMLLAVFAAGAPIGCRSSGATPARDEPLAGAWRPTPVAMRVYPSTRIVTQEGSPLLEARVELSDAMGDPLKAAGEFHLELYGGASDRQLYTWRVRVVTLDEQRTFYDPITRAYLMRLKLDSAAVVETAPHLRASFLTADGERLQADGAVRK